MTNNWVTGPDAHYWAAGDEQPWEIELPEVVFPSTINIEINRDAPPKIRPRKILRLLNDAVIGTIKKEQP